MKLLRFARPLGFVALALCIIGCADEPGTDGSATESPWLVVDMTVSPSAALTPPVQPNPVPDSLADLHRRAEHSFVSIQIANGARRMIIMETRHGSIPNQHAWGDKARYHFSDLDARLGAATQWELKNLQLLGLVKQPQGVVYQIPAQAKANPDKLKEFPTRALDEFEQEALKQLQDGKNAIAYIENDRVRMLGSIRMTRDCKQCHQQQAEGALLGAFTYDLARDPNPYKPAPKKAKNVEEIVLP